MAAPTPEVLTWQDNVENQIRELIELRDMIVKFDEWRDLFAQSTLNTARATAVSKATAAITALQALGVPTLTAV